eukprot:scaffold25729_cov137-Cylindrotheca_fusiformis.AAC.1
MTITWVVVKKKPTSKVGITFRSQHKQVTVAEVSGSAAEQTDLVPGLKVLQVNGNAVQTAKESCDIIRSAPAGEVEITTEGVHHIAKKQTENDNCGFEVRPSLTMEDFVEISRVDPSGMFPDLVCGHILWSINGNKIRNEMQANELLRTNVSLKLLVIEPEKMEDIAPALVKVESLLTGDMSLDD